MTTRIYGWLINIVTVLLFLSPLVNLWFIALQANMMNMSIYDFISQTIWPIAYLLGALCMPVAAILMQKKWRQAKVFKRHAKEYFCLTLFLMTVTLILMGKYMLMIFMVFLFLASKSALGIKYGEAFSRLTESASMRRLAGEWIILIVAIIVRVYIFSSLYS